MFTILLFLCLIVAARWAFCPRSKTAARRIMAAPNAAGVLGYMSDSEWKTHLASVDAQLKEADQLFRQLYPDHAQAASTILKKGPSKRNPLRPKTPKVNTPIPKPPIVSGSEQKISPQTQLQTPLDSQTKTIAPGIPNLKKCDLKIAGLKMSKSTLAKFNEYRRDLEARIASGALRTPLAAKRTQVAPHNQPALSLLPQTASPSLSFAQRCTAILTKVVDRVFTCARALSSLFARPTRLRSPLPRNHQS